MLAIEVESTLTDRYQTTVPDTVRRALRLSKRDKIHYSIQPDGAVMLTRASPKKLEKNDPLLDTFLHFLENDMAEHPERIQKLNMGMVDNIRQLVGHVDVDFEEPLREEDE